MKPNHSDFARIQRAARARHLLAALHSEAAAISEPTLAEVAAVETWRASPFISLRVYPPLPGVQKCWCRER